jgi:hypothetical protein
MVKYRESFKVNGRLYGIEDYEDGQDDHFMPDRATQRFHLWAGGCGIGGANSIEDARRLVHSYIVSHLRAERAGFQERANNADRCLSKLGEDFWGLAKFQLDFAQDAN